MKKLKHSAAVIAVVIMAFIMLSSAVYILAEANHDCIGEECQICSRIEACVKTVKLFKACISAVILFGIFAVFYDFCKCSDFSLRGFGNTVLFNIKLLN